MITFILMEPAVAGNVGAVARVLKNFGFKDLVIIDPKCDVKSVEAQGRAKHARGVLKRAKVSSHSILNSFHTVISTTAQLGSDYNIPRSPVTPEQLHEILPDGAIYSSRQPNIGILFGREGSGLTNEEVMASDFILTIPSQKDYPTLNLSHSVAIVAYELSKHRSTRKVHSHIPLATNLERHQLIKMLDDVLDRLDFATRGRKETQKKVWKRVFSKSFMSKRESFAVMGFFRHLLNKMKK